jgi:hypothetical protein
MITYELARKLKDAGFPQSELARLSNRPKGFGALGRGPDCWVSCEHVSEHGEWKNAHEGESPEDAVAQLWLSLNGQQQANGTA